MKQKIIMSVLVFWVIMLCELVGGYQILPSSSGMKLEAICSSKTLISAYKSTWQNNPEDQY
jgi:hypothetical protein